MHRPYGENPGGNPNLGAQMMAGYMLDTNVFNHVLDGQIDLNQLTEKNLYATHVQFDEMRKTRDDARRAQLLALFNSLQLGQKPTSSALPGVSVAGGACPSDGVLFAKMRNALDALNRRKRNNAHDILIAETAIVNGLVLVTADRDLMAITKQFGGTCEDARAWLGH